MKAMPLIGLTGSRRYDNDSVFLLCDYARCLLAAGGLPVLLPYDMSAAARAEALRRIDGLMLTGGVDADPALYGEEPIRELGSVCDERDALEIPLSREASALDLPILGICRGIQIFNVAMGGTLYQDIAAQLPDSDGVVHSWSRGLPVPYHPIRVTRESPFHSILCGESAIVNSYHHQAIKQPAPSLTPCAWSPDGVIEAAYDPNARFTLMVQWHPERMYRTDEKQAALFRAFVDACRAYARDRASSR